MDLRRSQTLKQSSWLRLPAVGGTPTHSPAWSCRTPQLPLFPAPKISILTDRSPSARPCVLTPRRLSYVRSGPFLRRLSQVAGPETDGCPLPPQDTRSPGFPAKWNLANTDHDLPVPECSCLRPSTLPRTPVAICRCTTPAFLLHPAGCECHDHTLGMLDAIRIPGPGSSATSARPCVRISIAHLPATLFRACRKLAVGGHVSGWLAADVRVPHRPSWTGVA